MKSIFNNHKIASWSLPLVAVALLFGLAGSGDAKPGEAKAKGPKATFVKGSVEVSSSADGTFKKVKRNRRVKPGSFLKTGEGSRAELRFADGSVLRVGPSSMLHIKNAAFNSSTKKVDVETTLIGGKAWANVSKLVGSDAQFKVKTQNAVAGVRGTVFRVNIEKDKASVVKVYNGAVAVSNSPFFNNQDESGDNNHLNPIDKNRKVLAAPPFQEVNKKEWEQIVKQMMVVRVGPSGSMSQPVAFKAEDEKASASDSAWVAWNEACDKGDCK